MLNATVGLGSDVYDDGSPEPAAPSPTTEDTIRPSESPPPQTVDAAVALNFETMLRVSLQVLPRIQLTDPIHPRFGGAQVRS